MPVAQVPHEPPQPSLPHRFVPQLGVQPATHCPFWHEVPVPHVPQVPPQPLLPQTFVPQVGVQVATHCPFVHVVPAAQGPQVPPQPSLPQLPGAQMGVHCCVHVANVGVTWRKANHAVKAVRPVEPCVAFTRICVPAGTALPVPPVNFHAVPPERLSRVVSFTVRFGVPVISTSIAVVVLSFVENSIHQSFCVQLCRPKRGSQPQGPSAASV